MPGIKAMTLTPETIDQFRSWCTGRGRAPNTVKAYATDLKMFLQAAGENETVTREEYEELAASWLNLTRGTAAPKTTGRRLTSLKAFAKWAGWEPVLVDYIAPSPGRTIPHPLPEGVVGVDKLLEQAKNHEQRALVAMIGRVGSRIGEALDTTIESFDLTEMMWTIRGKGDKTRTVPVSEKAWEWIMPAYVLAFSKPDHRLVSYKDRFARQIITNLGRRAGMAREISSHDLRATFATEAYNHCGDIRVVQEMLGHSSVETTEIYTGVSIASMKAAVEF